MCSARKGMHHTSHPCCSSAGSPHYLTPLICLPPSVPLHPCHPHLPFLFPPLCSMEAVRESLRDEALRRAVVRAVRAEDLISEAQCVQVRKLVLGCA